MYLGYRIYKHNILLTKQIEQGESPEIADPTSASRCRSNIPQMIQLTKSLPQFVVVWHTLEELCHLMVGINGLVVSGL